MIKIIRNLENSVLSTGCWTLTLLTGTRGPQRRRWRQWRRFGISGGGTDIRDIVYSAVNAVTDCKTCLQPAAAISSASACGIGGRQFEPDRWGTGAKTTHRTLTAAIQ